MVGYLKQCHHALPFASTSVYMVNNIEQLIQVVIGTARNQASCKGQSLVQFLARVGVMGRVK